MSTTDIQHPWSAKPLPGSAQARVSPVGAMGTLRHRVLSSLPLKPSGHTALSPDNGCQNQQPPKAFHHLSRCCEEPITGEKTKTKLKTQPTPNLPHKSSPRNKVSVSEGWVVHPKANRVFLCLSRVWLKKANKPQRKHVMVQSRTRWCHESVGGTGGFSEQRMPVEEGNTEKDRQNSCLGGSWGCPSPG